MIIIIVINTNKKKICELILLGYHDFMVESWFCEQLFMSVVPTCYSNYLGEKYKRKN